MKKLIDFRITSETPVFLGGYDTEYFHANLDTEEGFRIQSLKGIWRWWMRAYIAGALWDRDGKVDLDKLIKLTGSILGSAVDKESQASKLVIRLRMPPSISYMEILKEDALARKLTRVGLTMLDKKRMTVARQLEVELEICERSGVELTKEEGQLALSSLLSALVLCGMGKMGRRGMGAFKLDELRSFEDFLPIDLLKMTPVTPENAEGFLKSLIKTAHDAAHSFVKSQLELKKERGVPSLPSISKGDIEGFPAYSLYIFKVRKSALDIAADFQDFCTRPRRLSRLRKDPARDTDVIIDTKRAWALGLPRSQRGTGYLTDVERRASPFIFAAHENWATLSIFYSSDWSRKVTWKGGPRGIVEKVISVPEELATAMKVVRDSLIDYFKVLRYSVAQIWP